MCSKKAIVFSISIFLLILGVATLTLWGKIYSSLLQSELSISNNSKGYNMWKETPIPMYMSFYLFNWTNSAEVIKNSNVKPIFEECGPYVYLEKHIRVNVNWTENDTVTYQQKRIWHFVPEMSNGSLDDPITNLNVIATTIATIVKDMNPIIIFAVNFMLNEKERSIALTRTADQWLFKGFDDELLTLAAKLNISGLHFPFDKFGWFYSRNNSETYDGTFKMYRGTQDLDLLGIMEEWNGSPRSKYYNGYCSYVNGTSGELWPPVNNVNKVYVFSPDVCSSVALSHENVTPEVEGIQGRQFEGTDYLFDNGTKYPDNICFNNKKILPSGVRDVSKCRFGAPAFVSYPHFTLADPIYANAVEGMRPNFTKYNFRVALEPTTGIPLNVNAQLQINIRIEPIKGISMFHNVKTIMMPMVWFQQTAQLTPDFAGQIKLLLILPSLGMYSGSGVVAVGALLFLIGTYLSFKDSWKKNQGEQLLSEKAL